MLYLLLVSLVMSHQRRGISNSLHLCRQCLYLAVTNLCVVCAGESACPAEIGRMLQLILACAMNCHDKEREFAHGTHTHAKTHTHLNTHTNTHLHTQKHTHTQKNANTHTQLTVYTRCTHGSLMIHSPTMIFIVHAKNCGRYKLASKLVENKGYLRCKMVELFTIISIAFEQ